MPPIDDGLSLAHELGRIFRNSNAPFCELAVEMESVQSRFLEQASGNYWMQLETQRRVAEMTFKLTIRNPTAPQGESKRRFEKLCELGFSDSARRACYWSIYADHCLARDEAISLLRELECLLEGEAIQVNQDLAHTREAIAKLSEQRAHGQLPESPAPQL